MKRNLISKAENRNVIHKLFDIKQWSKWRFSLADASDRHQHLLPLPHPANPPARVHRLAPQLHPVGFRHPVFPQVATFIAAQRRVKVLFQPPAPQLDDVPRGERSVRNHVLSHPTRLLPHGAFFFFEEVPVKDFCFLYTKYLHVLGLLAAIV